MTRLTQLTKATQAKDVLLSSFSEGKKFLHVIGFFDKEEAQSNIVYGYTYASTQDRD